jgi:uncharacterized membrane protein
MQSASFKPVGQYYLRNAVNMLMAVALFFLAFYQYQYRDAIMVKLGMSHLFSPGFVGFLTYFTMLFSLFSAVYLALQKNRSASLPALIVFSSYTAYCAAIIIKTHSYCGCANIFFELDLRVQLAIGILLVTLSSAPLFSRKRI